MKDGSYFRFFSFGLAGYADRLLMRVRNEIVDTFHRTFAPGPPDSVLDVGVSANDHPSSNFFEKRYPHPEQITAVGLGAFGALEADFPGLTYLRANGCALPFRDRAFDYVYSHAVIEHVGHRDNQLAFVRELLRVSRRGMLFTTPNRDHPVELHTGLPLLHYLPPQLHRGFYRRLGKAFYATEDNLNLLSTRDVARLVETATDGQPSVIDYHPVRWLGLCSNIVVSVRTLE